MRQELTSLRIYTNRLGNTSEIIQYLGDLEKAYNSIYFFYDFLENFDPNSKRAQRHFFFLREFGYPFIDQPNLNNNPDSILPIYRLELTKINISSPGFWEVVGSLNPLEVIRNFLNDRHKRRQDKEWRERLEKEKMEKENQLLQVQILEGENRVVRERIQLYRELGYSDQKVQELIWANVTQPLLILGKHQDSKLITDATGEGQQQPNN